MGSIQMNLHERLSRLGLWIVASYLWGIAVLGLYASRRVRDSTSFLLVVDASANG